MPFAEIYLQQLSVHASVQCDGVVRRNGAERGQEHRHGLLLHRGYLHGGGPVGRRRRAIGFLRRRRLVGTNAPHDHGNHGQDDQNDDDRAKIAALCRNLAGVLGQQVRRILDRLIDRLFARLFARPSAGLRGRKGVAWVCTLVCIGGERLSVGRILVVGDGHEDGWTPAKFRAV